MVRRTQGGASSRILAAATELFAERGYRDTTIEDIAVAAEISRSSLFWHFQSKEGILQAVIEEVSRSWGEEIWEVGEQYRGLDAAEAAIRAQAEHYVSQPTLARLAVVLYGEIYSAESKLSHLFSELSDDMAKALTRWLSQAIEDGEIRSDVDARAVSVVVAAAIVGIGKKWAMDPDYDITEAHNRILLLLHYLRPSSAVRHEPRRRGQESMAKVVGKSAARSRGVG